jgi:hypothetical protein
MTVVVIPKPSAKALGYFRPFGLEKAKTEGNEGSEVLGSGLRSFASFCSDLQPTPGLWLGRPTSDLQIGDLRFLCFLLLMIFSDRSIPAVAGPLSLSRRPQRLRPLFVTLNQLGDLRMKAILRGVDVADRAGKLFLL